MNRPLDEAVGRCERINNCTYHLPPRQYLREHGMFRKPESWGDYLISRYHKPSQPLSPVEPSRHTLPLGYVCQTMTAYSRNKLVMWLWQQFSDRLSAGQFGQLLTEYCVGTSARWDGSTVWWQIDTDRQVRTGKIMDYDPATGRRVKDSQGRARMSWVHAIVDEGRREGFSLRQCLYGAHLLARYPDARLWVLESEKGALITAMVLESLGLYGDIIPIATGGCGALTADKYERLDPLSRMAPLRGRDVTLLPDDGVYTQWADKARDLAGWCSHIDVSPLADSRHGPSLPGGVTRFDGNGPDDLFLQCPRSVGALAYGILGVGRP